MSRCISTSLIGLPRIRALPAVGKISLIRSLIAVDLPAVRPDKTKYFAGLDLHVKPFERRSFHEVQETEGIFFGQIFSFNRWSWHAFIVGKPRLTVNPSARTCVRRENTKKETFQSRCAKSGVAADMPNLDQLRLRRRRRRDHWQGLQVLRVAPVIQYPHLLHARNGATRRTKLFGGVLSAPHLRD